MDEKLNLIEILKDCPRGTQLYSIIYGDVKFERFTGSELYPILMRIDDSRTVSFSADGKMYYDCGECALFPSKDQRDWFKFTAPCLKKDKFDPTTLRHFNKVLVRDTNAGHWRCAFYSHNNGEFFTYKYATIGGKDYKYCIPYNKKTKHLVDTNEEAPEYYRYWDD